MTSECKLIIGIIAITLEDRKRSERSGVHVDVCRKKDSDGCMNIIIINNLVQ